MKELGGLFVLFLACLASPSSAQKATLQLDTNAIQLGAQTDAFISFEYRIDSGSGTTLIWPELKDTLNAAVEIIQTGRIDTGLVDENDPYLFRQSLKLRLTSFDTGYHVIKPLQFSFNGELIESNPALLHVQGIELGQKAEEKAIKDIRKVNYTWFDRIIPYWWVLLVIGGIVLGVFRLKKFKKNKAPTEAITPSEPQVPAHITAIEQLKRLKEKELWQKGLSKSYHTELTDILRAYIEDRFDVPAMEETSNQLLQELRNYGIAKNDLQLLPQLLRIADFVKFAKYKPLPEENEMAMKNALTFIEQTAEVTKTK